MLFRFIGQYTNGHTTINVGGPAVTGGVTFEGHEPAEVEREDLVRRLLKNPEFEAIGPLDHDGDGEPGGSVPAEGDPEELAALRADYQQALGKRPYYGWDADELRRRIAEAKETQQ